MLKSLYLVKMTMIVMTTERSY